MVYLIFVPSQLFLNVNCSSVGESAGTIVYAWLSPNIIVVVFTSSRCLNAIATYYL